MCINGAGKAYSWLRNQLKSDISYDELNHLGASINIGADGLHLLPFGNGAERLMHNKNIGAHWANMDFNQHTFDHMIRATLEGVAFSFHYGMNIMKDLGTSLHVIKTGNDNLFQSEVFAQTIATLSDAQIQIVENTGATGAAIGAGIGANIFDSIEDAFYDQKVIKTYNPELNRDAYEQAYGVWLASLKQKLEMK